MSFSSFDSKITLDQPAIVADISFFQLEDASTYSNDQSIIDQWTQGREHRDH